MSAGADARLGAVREEDRFDADALGSWLGAQLPETGGGDVRVRQFRGGASNLTYLLTFASSGRELVLRRPPLGARSGAAHDMGREFRIQARLKPVYPYVPEMYALCEDPAVIGAPFYVMERVPGVVCGLPVPEQIGAGPEQLDSLGEAFVRALVRLHHVDVRATGLADLGRGPGYVERQLTQWTERYGAARTRNVPSFHSITSWLEENRPRDTGLSLIHNDFRLDNMVFAADGSLRLRGVLDWELATVGDPLMDLGCALAYWVQRSDSRLARRFCTQPSCLPDAPSRADIIARYGDLAGRPMDGFAFYEVFGLFRLAAIVQQIYARYVRRETTNPAFRRFWMIVWSLHNRARYRVLVERGAQRRTIVE